MYTLLRRTAALAAAAALLSVSPALSDGVFVDRDGKQHAWSINDAHTLIWDSVPYIPVGGMFCPRYFVEGQTEENWTADVESLKQIRERGVTDIYVNPVRPATSVPAAAWQRLIDELESQGFRYGIELTDGPTAPLNAWIIQPNLYRLADITSEKTVVLDLPGLKSGIWAVSDSVGNIAQMGSVTPVDGKASITVRGSDGKPRVLLIYPVKTLDTGETGLQNFWEGYGEYRDRLLAVFRKLRFGPGMRFWVDPFINEMGLRGDAAFALPASRAYQVELEAWLRKRYTDFDSLSRAWSLPNDIKTHEEASRLIPMWRGFKGLTQFYDAGTGKTLKLTSGNTRAWEDLNAFRTDSIRGYLNMAAAALKREIANVPVVVKWTANDQYLLNSDLDGFDGIGVEAYGSPSEIGPFAGAQCLSMVRQSKRPMWLLATEMQTTPLASKQGVGFASRDELTACLTALKDSGSKGFFVFGFRLSPPWSNFDLLQAPEQIGWLKDFGDRVLSEPLFSDWSPRVMWYSAQRPLGADNRRLEKDLWWLAKFDPADEITVAPGVRAYAMRDAEGQAVYLWSAGAPMSIEIQPPPGVQPQIFFTGTDERKAVVSKKSITIPLTRDPVVVRGMDPSQFVLKETLIQQMDRLAGLIRKAEGTNVLLGEYRMALDNVQAMIKSDRLALAQPTLKRALNELESLLAPYAWVEGEDASETSFTQEGYDPAVSGDRFLKIDQMADPPVAPYYCAYAVYVPAEGEYDLWLAGTLLGDPGAPPISWSLDNGSWAPVSEARPEGDTYGPGMRWSRLARIPLTTGKHVIRFRLDGRSPATGKYSLSIDAVVIHREKFVPDGPRRPVVR